MNAKPNKVGMVFAVVLAGWHIVWAALVVAGLAQAIMDFVFWAHMIEPVYKVRPFDPVAALSLVLITAGSGYLFGLIAAVIWNRLHRN